MSFFIGLPLTVGAMRRWGIRGREPITRYRACKREQSMPNHLNPNGV